MNYVQVVLEDNMPIFIDNTGHVLLNSDGKPQICDTCPCGKGLCECSAFPDTLFVEFERRNPAYAPSDARCNACTTLIDGGLTYQCNFESYEAYGEDCNAGGGVYSRINYRYDFDTPVCTLNPLYKGPWEYIRLFVSCCGSSFSGFWAYRFSGGLYGSGPGGNLSLTWRSGLGPYFYVDTTPPNSFDCDGLYQELPTSTDTNFSNTPCPVSGPNLDAMANIDVVVYS